MAISFGTSPKLGPAGKAALSAYLESVINERNSPATWFGATTAQGELYFDFKGERVWGEASKGEVKDDTLLQLFSTSKLVTTVAALQQVEQGKIGLDDPVALYKICPELAVAGAGGVCRGWYGAIAAAEYGDHIEDAAEPHECVPSMWSPNTPVAAFIQPLAFHPGTHFRYGIGIDWAGIMVTRLSGLDLETYFQKNIWAPCGVKSISFIPPRDWDEVAMAMTERVPFHTGKVELMKGPAMGRPMNPDDIGPNFMGGGGLFGPARDYLAFLRGLLRSTDPSAPSSERLLLPDTFALLFTDSIPAEHAESIRADIAGMAHRQAVHDPAMLTDGTGEQLGYGPALFLNKVDSKFGRKAMSGFWDGAAKTYYWLDPTSGIAGICFTNMLSHNPDPFNEVFNTFERTLYDHLELE